MECKKRGGHKKQLDGISGEKTENTISFRWLECTLPKGEKIETPVAKTTKKEGGGYKSKKEAKDRREKVSKEENAIRVKERVEFN